MKSNAQHYVYVFTWNIKKRSWNKHYIVPNDLFRRMDKPIEIYEKEKLIASGWIDENNETKTHTLMPTWDCLSFRMRPDGLIGIQTRTSDTRLSVHRGDEDKVGKRTDKDVAHWNNKKGAFSLVKGVKNAI